MLTPRSCSHLTLVSPRRNHSSSANTDRVWTFLVVTSGKPSPRSKRIWCPNTDSVPVPVRSPLSAPSSRIRWRRSRYARMAANLLAETDRPGDRRTRVTTHPDRVTLAVDEDPPTPAESGALRGDVRRGQPVAGQPLGHPRVEAAGHGVLGDPHLRAEGTDLHRALAALGVRADHADVHARSRRPVRLERQHLLGGVQQHPDPAGAVVDPLEVTDLRGVDPQGPDDPLAVLLGHLAGPDERRPGESQTLPSSQPHQAGATLLHQRALG